MRFRHVLYLAVMDADLQHDEELLPQMLELLRRGDTDLVVGSRYVEGGEARGLSAARSRLSRMAASFAQLVLGSQLQDSLSGFVMLTREPYLRSARRVSGQAIERSGICERTVVFLRGLWPGGFRRNSRCRLSLRPRCSLVGCRIDRDDHRGGLEFLGFLDHRLASGTSGRNGEG